MVGDNVGTGIGSCVGAGIGSAVGTGVGSFVGTGVGVVGAGIDDSDTIKKAIRRTMVISGSNDEDKKNFLL